MEKYKYINYILISLRLYRYCQAWLRNRSTSRIHRYIAKFPRVPRREFSESWCTSFSRRRVYPYREISSYQGEKGKWRTSGFGDTRVLVVVYRYAALDKISAREKVSEKHLCGEGKFHERSPTSVPSAERTTTAKTLLMNKFRRIIAFTPSLLASWAVTRENTRVKERGGVYIKRSFSSSPFLTYFNFQLNTKVIKNTKRFLFDFLSDHRNLSIIH